MKFHFYDHYLPGRTILPSISELCLTASEKLPVIFEMPQEQSPWTELAGQWRYVEVCEVWSPFRCRLSAQIPFYTKIPFHSRTLVLWLLSVNNHWHFLPGTLAADPFSVSIPLFLSLLQAPPCGSSCHWPTQAWTSFCLSAVGQNWLSLSKFLLRCNLDTRCLPPSSNCSSHSWAHSLVNWIWKGPSSFWLSSNIGM